MDYCYEKTKCKKCGRKILVEMGLFGVAHHTMVTATCGACLSEIDEAFRQKHPEAAKDIENWIK